MRRQLLILVIACSTCSRSHAEEPTLSTASKTEASLKAVIERLEARVAALEEELQRMKRVRQQIILGGSLLEATSFQMVNDVSSDERMHIDRTGVIRSPFGKPLGYWGIDFSTHDMRSGPNPSR